MGEGICEWEDVFLLVDGGVLRKLIDALTQLSLKAWKQPTSAEGVSGEEVGWAGWVGPVGP